MWAARRLQTQRLLSASTGTIQTTAAVSGREPITVGTVGERTREQLQRLLLAVTSQDAERLVDALVDLGVVRRRMDRDLLRRDLEYLVSHYYGRPLCEVSVGTLIAESLAIVRRRHLQLPPNLALLLKTLVMNGGLLARPPLK